MKPFPRKFPFFFAISTLFLILLKYGFVKGLYETKAYPLIHLMTNRNTYVGSSNYMIKSNLINILTLYKDVKIEADNSTIDDLLDVDDETKIERIVEEKMQIISKHVSSRQLLKYSGVIYLYEIVHGNNFYFLLHFILRNNNNGVVIVVPEGLHIDREEYLKVNSAAFKTSSTTDGGSINLISDDLLEKRILFIQKFLLNFKLNQPVYFVKNNKEVERIYQNYKGKFGFFDLTRNVSIMPLSKNQYRNKISAKNIFYFLSKDNIHINSVFNKIKNSETFLFTKRKTIVIAVDYNVFSILSSHPSHSTATNTQIIAMTELIKLFFYVYKNEDINYNILFLFTNYYFGIDHFFDSMNIIFRESIEFVLTLESLNDMNIFFHQSKKIPSEHVMRFYNILKGVVMKNLQKEIQLRKEKIKTHSKHLPRLHEYFELKNIDSITLSAKELNLSFIHKTPLIEQKIKPNDVLTHIRNIFEALYVYVKSAKGESSNDKDVRNDNGVHNDNDVLKYTNQMIGTEEFIHLNENLNKFMKFFVYQEEVEKFINHVKMTVDPFITDSNFLIMDYKIPHDKKQKYFYQKSAIITFSMAISYIFHYLHFLVVALFLALVYIFVNFHVVPSFYKAKVA
ncbi:conserved Plasmodium protein, unknown function [Plasmodium knowlesi strain H]|uniref:Nicalin n=3 Tax=Plasmodium knowlesi TaxID=5850 RepID=A0A5K1UIA5_PLAKH|nr:conserved Plasmodium protein, unknown function [Plasmodium knowlesi strain H]OTN65844.1 Uncharacterized protein PKNOH_S100041100 [Plasmodium knowlesi]CAA9987774.1 conserved Plasmodium protein, unknown function [Plasmodium knowlesi strain H]SBO27101.1 conserved Plasmodium protein, unknown function [Plasmodium knowlesi strain H]SBO29423.1 conserved Plasmodium protein, unknown function [Plasmodium knowlesi strain H]VVS77248.1 conserved Plasmodium protein, unknown function [Plasmodium knowlesi |eukprot:XP_002258771.1 hypothetical protein, conserved in Plasmodium species [Plasmodium knowlesi strain H]